MFSSRFYRKHSGIVSATALAAEPLPPEKELSLVQVGQGQPFVFTVPEEQPGPTNSTPLRVPHCVLAAQLFPLPGPPQALRTTAFRKRKAAKGHVHEQNPSADVTVHLQQVQPAKENQDQPNMRCKCVVLRSCWQKDWRRRPEEN